MTSSLLKRITKRIATKKASGRSLKSLDSLLITPRWILENLRETIIYKEFDISNLSFTPLRKLNKKTIPYFDIEKLKNETYFPQKDAKTTAEKVLSILLNSNVRRGSISNIQQYIPVFMERINTIIRDGQPITLVLTAMPHKKQNPITTGHSIDFVDLGEYLCFQQLKNIIHSISRVYIPGAKIILVPDGVALAHFFAQSNVKGVILYRNKLKKIIEQLGLLDAIEIVDLQDIISMNASFPQVKEEIKQHLRALELVNKEVRKGIRIIKKATLFNIPFSHSINEHINLMKLSVDKMPSGIVDQIEFVAFEYLAILLTLKRLNLFEKSFPNTLRISVHCKNTSSIPINLVNDTSQIFPYNGIPVVRMQKYIRNHNLRTSTRIMRLYEIYKYPSATAVYIEGQQEPFYYEIESLRESLH